MSRHSILPLALPLALLAASSAVQAKEYPIGEAQQCAGLNIAAVYLQPVEMSPAGVMRAAAQSDVHLEADISALSDNPQGFEEGSFVPYLEVAYSLRKHGSDEQISGEFHPMVANDGPHYGDNVKLAGPGQYSLTFVVTPPGNHHSFGLHTDRETGVTPWFERCEQTYEFTFAGVGKKGGY